MEEHHILQPLIPTTAAATGDDVKESTSLIMYRMVLVIFIAVVSIWANYEASKGFEVTIINDAGDTPAGRRFALFFVSNDKATRVVLNTSQFAEKVLYPNSILPKKQVSRVILRLAGRNLTHPVVVNVSNNHEFVIHISPSVMEETNIEKAMVSAVQRGMARVWLCDAEMSAPKSLLDGMVEYVGISAGFATSQDSGSLKLPVSDNNSCWDDRDSAAVAHFLNYCERVRHGFIGRLNQALCGEWHMRMVDDALGVPAQQLCSFHYSLTLDNEHNGTHLSLKLDSEPLVEM